MEFDWENLLDEWDGENYQESLAWKNCSGPKRNLSDFSNRDCTSASTDCVAAMSRLHLCVPAMLAKSEKQDTLQKNGSVPDSMHNPDCELVVG